MSNGINRLWPYAAKAIIQHDFDIDHLNIWITFRLPMKIQTGIYNPLGPFDLKPPDEKWIVELDDVETSITSSQWLDQYTMFLLIESVAVEPNKVTLKYDGPDESLRTIWDKQWEYWAKIESLTGWPTTFKRGMIIIWYGSIVSIPSGWHLCDGTESTPDLRDKFVVGAGNTLNPNDTGGEASHLHNITAQPTAGPSATVSVTPGGMPVATGTHTHSLTGVTASKNTLPPYYSLCYIMKL